jgi:outer membrane lipoprotein
MTGRQQRLSLAALILLMIAACSPFSKSIRQQVDERLTFAQVQRNPDQFMGKKVLWGGVIIKATNTDAETLIEVRQADLDLETRPKDLDRSQGRFLVRYGGFLDPAIYVEGREITVFGEIIGKEDMPLGETRYTYPIVRSEKLHLWEKRQVYPYPYYAYPYYDPWFWDYYPYPWFYGPYPYRWHHR